MVLQYNNLYLTIKKSRLAEFTSDSLKISIQDQKIQILKAFFMTEI